MRFAGKRNVAEEVDCLKRGGVVIFPTDMIYGLLADAADQDAVDRIFKIKEKARSDFCEI